MKNNGKLLETLIENSFNYYRENKIALVNRIYLPINFAKVNNENKLINSKIINKSTVDFCGVYNGHFFAFDAKSTLKEFFLTSNIAAHQKNYLLNVVDNKGIGFIVIGFVNLNRFFYININKIDFSKHKITINDLENNGFEINMILPGFIDFIDGLKRDIIN